jgi:hypothetical protein
MAYFWLGVSLFFAIWSSPFVSEAACLDVRTLPNRVIALIDGREEPSPETSRIARNLAGALAQKGLYPLYVDVAAPLPASLDTADLAGVLSWFASDVPDPQGVADWLAVKTKECGTALPHVAIGELGGAPLWHHFGVDRAGAAILHDGARHKVEVARDWMRTPSLVDVASGLVVAPVVPTGGVPIVRMNADDGMQRVLGFQRGKQTWLSDRLMPAHARPGDPSVDLDRLFAPYLGEALSPVPDLAMFQGRRIALSVLLADGWQLRAPPSEGASLGTPAYVLARKIFLADDAPVTFGWPDPVMQKGAEEADAAAEDLIQAPHVHSLPRTETKEFLSLGVPFVIRLLPESTDGSDASPLPVQSAVVPLGGVSGFGDPAGLHARAAAVARSGKPWPSAPDMLVVRARDLLTEAGQSAVAQARALHASSNRAAMGMVQYAALLKGAVSTQIEPIGTHVWRVSNRGAMHSLRFDQSKGLQLDLTRSRGVLGSWLVGSALFVALDPAVKTAVVALSSERSGAGGELQAIELVEAGPKLEQLQRDGCRTTALIEGSGQITVRAPVEPQVQLEGDHLPVTARGHQLWQFVVPDRPTSSRKLSFAVGCL